MISYSNFSNTRVNMATLYSNFFRASHLTEYKKLIRSTLRERNMTVLNLEDLLQYLNMTRLDLAYNLRKSIPREKRKTQEREQNIASIIHNLASSMCVDIGELYGRQAVERTVKAVAAPGTPSKFDILVLIDADYETLNLKSKTALMDQRFDKINGFIVTELGECKSEPDVHSVNLICSNVSGGGAILMGAYLYCIKNTPSLPQLGLLELAGGFGNTMGLCAYSKFGYVANLAYLGPHCFADSNNLPMTVDVARLTVDQIIAVVQGTAKVSQIDIGAREKTIFDMLHTHPLCNRSLFVSDNEQAELAQDYNRLYRHMYSVRSLTGYKPDASDIPNNVMKLIRHELQDKVDYYEEKREKTGKKLTEDEKTAVVGEIVKEKLTSKIAILTDIVNEIQETKRMLLDRKIRKLRREFDDISDPTKKREIIATIKSLESQIAAINRFRGEDTPSPQSIRSAATTETEVSSSKSPSVMSVISDEDREAEMAHMYVTKAKAKSMYLKKKSAKKAAKKTAKKLAAKKASAAKKTARMKVSTKSIMQAPWIPASPKSVVL